MLTNFLVVLEENREALAPYAISLAKELHALATAIRPRREAGGLADGSVEARYELALGDADARKARAKEDLEAYAMAASAAGADFEALMPDDGQDPRRDQVAAFARAFDFSVIGQPEPGRSPALNDLAGNLLTESGRPVLVVPAIQRAPASLRRLIVAWDGSMASSRAFADAHALFKNAERVEIVTVTGPSTSNAVLQGGERLARRLTRGGVAGTFRRLPSEEDPANAILSYVADVGADLLIAGGYGHSRLLETLFGGVTRTFLSSQTLPLFLSR